MKFLLIVAACTMIFNFAFHSKCMTQVIPLDSSQTRSSTVTSQPIPAKPGSVSPLPFEDPLHAYVIAEGRARIYDGHVESARNVALRVAYAEAVSRVAGTEIGSLSIIRNVHKVSDVVMARSIGFVRHYEIIREEVSPTDPRYYEVVIRADVITKGVPGQDDIDGLRLYLELLDNPTLLILLPERSMPANDPQENPALSSKKITVRSGDMMIRISESDQSPPSDTLIHAETHVNELTLQGPEAAMAQAFASYGYRVITSDELLENGLVGPEVIAAARRGATQEALMAARAAKADLALIGGMRFSESLVSPYGVTMTRISSEVSAKAVVTSSGRNLAIFHQTYLAASPDRLMAYTQSAHKAADGIAKVLAWKIPQILAQESKETRLIIHGVDYHAAEKVRQALLDNGEIDDARLARLPTVKNPRVELLLYSSFLGIEPGQVIDICQEALNSPVRIVNGDRYSIELETLQ
jgi:hypothetical protein